MLELLIVARLIRDNYRIAISQSLSPLLPSYGILEIDISLSYCPNLKNTQCSVG